MNNGESHRIIELYNCGIIEYNKASDIQKQLLNNRISGNIQDSLILLQHPHTYTLGKTADRNNLICSEEYLSKKKISVYNTDRGGDITYHGPGQIVGYPVINLKEWHQDAHLYLRSLEEVIIRTLSDYGINGGRSEGLTGVWIEERKIAAIGIRISHWITMHGFALNVNTDMSYFDGIIPCGIRNKSVTSMERELNSSLNIEDVKNNLIEKFLEIFSYNTIIKKDSEEIYQFQ